MKTLNYIIIAGITLFLFSCENNTRTDGTNSNITHEEHVSDLESIELNNGEKWKVVDEMMAHIRNMENDVQQFEVRNESNYSVLAINLQNNINLLTSNCTMEGKAHDELHKWLLPYISMVDDLSNAESNEKEIEVYSKIQSSFKIFNTYFK